MSGIGGIRRHGARDDDKDRGTGATHEAPVNLLADS